VSQYLEPFVFVWH